LRIAATQYSLANKSFEIYISGCREHPCKGCHNPELHNENIGIELNKDELNKIKDKINDFTNLINNIFILGGEPLEKPIKEVEWLLGELKKTKKEIWLFTRFEFEQVPKEIKELVDYLKCGKYIEELKTDDNIQYGVKLATKNQRIYKLKEGN